jgi:hypothetical protein
MSKETTLMLSSLLALIFSATGAILLLVTPWAYWSYRFEGGGYIYYGSGTVTVLSGVEGPFIALAALLLLLCAIISLLTLIPGTIKNRTPMVISLISAFVVLIMIIIGVILTVVIMDAEGLYWSFGAGFYGGLFGALLTIFFTFIMLHAKGK